MIPMIFSYLDSYAYKATTQLNSSSYMWGASTGDQRSHSLCWIHAYFSSYL